MNVFEYNIEFKLYNIYNLLLDIKFIYHIIIFKNSKIDLIKERLKY